MILYGQLLAAVKAVFHELPVGIEHSLRVLANAEQIMHHESLTCFERETVITVALLHDIGAVEAQRKYQSIAGHYQEQEGPAVARSILAELGYDKSQIDRCCFIIGHHHTPSKIDGLDFQIQWEADLLENIPYMKFADANACRDFMMGHFKTKIGSVLARQFYEAAYPD
jgi:hypothetical protein